MDESMTKTESAMKANVFNRGRVRLYGHDCRDVLRSLADNSVDSVVTDPPYALVSVGKRFGKADSAPAKHGRDGVYARASAGFMGESWDTGEVAFATEFWEQVHRVLKPGGHVLAFSATRTYHRLACAIEDAGFEIRDQLAWMYGSGFPKSHDVALNIDKASGLDIRKDADYSPITPEAQEWAGWGTALKPGWEPICMGRKELVGSVANNVLTYGTGALNIDASRVGDSGGTKSTGEPNYKNDVYGEGMGGLRAVDGNMGRWPANIIHDGSDEVLLAFEALNGSGAARFFYSAKASARDRDEGLELFAMQVAGGMQGRADGSLGSITKRKNVHPTVKPTILMEHLVRMVTPPGGIVLDPFMGSGSTGKAAALHGFRFIGCERDARYIPISAARIEWAVRQHDEKEWERFLGVA